MKTFLSAIVVSAASVNAHGNDGITIDDHTHHQHNGRNNDWQVGLHDGRRAESWGGDGHNGGLEGYDGHNGGFTFTSVLGPDPTAVPFWTKFRNYPYTRSNGMAAVEISTDGTLKMLIKWELLGDDALSSTNKNIGVHVHAGDPSTNGPIVWGCCGEDPLPPFGGPCSQQSTEEGAIYTCQFCDMAPPAPCFRDGKSTPAEAALELLGGKMQMYVNLHTDESLANNDGQPLGLIRGQLMEEKGGSDAKHGDDADSDIQQYTDPKSGGLLRGSVETSRKTFFDDKKP